MNDALPPTVHPIVHPIVHAILPARRTAHVIGRHRIRFLNAMTSVGLMKAGPGDARFATMSTATGKHLGQLRVEVAEESLTITTPAASFERLFEGLKKHRIADDIRWTPAEEDATELGLYADDAGLLGEALQRLGATGVPDADGRWVDATIGVGGGPDGVQARITRLGAAASELGRTVVYIRIGDPAIARTLSDTLAASGCARLDAEAFDAARIEALWPDDTLDLPDEAPTLASTRLVGTVDWDKGCFLGQEVFVMARDRGEAPKRLIAFEVDGAPPPTGTEIRVGEMNAGVTGSAAPLPGGGARILGMVKRRHAAAALTLADGRPLRARV
jgi:folate-binding Fe-S cluster repair protein YgfZ